MFGRNKASQQSTVRLPVGDGEYQYLTPKEAEKLGARLQSLWESSHPGQKAPGKNYLLFEHIKQREEQERSIEETRRLQQERLTSESIAKQDSNARRRYGPPPSYGASADAPDSYQTATYTGSVPQHQPYPLASPHPSSGFGGYTYTSPPPPSGQYTTQGPQYPPTQYPVSGNYQWSVSDKQRSPYGYEPYEGRKG